MLDSDTKRRIDTARDILVGKVPDPKSQVEQITIALIYKFMDDMDAESEEFGGKRSFFAGEFARYGWTKLMSAGLGGHETLNLYAEAIAKMPENPGIPPLFRDIFNNAYLGTVKLTDLRTCSAPWTLPKLLILSSSTDQFRLQNPRILLNLTVPFKSHGMRPSVMRPTYQALNAALCQVSGLTLLAKFLCVT